MSIWVMRFFRSIPSISPARVSLKRSLPRPASAAAPGGAEVKRGTVSSEGRFSTTTSRTPSRRSAAMLSATAVAAPTAAAATASGVGVGVATIAPTMSLAPAQTVATGRRPRVFGSSAKRASWSGRSSMIGSLSVAPRRGGAAEGEVGGVEAARLELGGEMLGPDRAVRVAALVVGRRHRRRPAARGEAVAGIGQAVAEDVEAGVAHRRGDAAAGGEHRAGEHGQGDPSHAVPRAIVWRQ